MYLNNASAVLMLCACAKHARVGTPPQKCTFCKLYLANISVCVLQGKNYRYGYAVSAKLPASYGYALSKFDLQVGTTKQWFEPGCIPVEPLMIPHPNSKKEDDGVVLSIVMGADGKSFLLCLDAGSFEELGRAQLPYGIPYGFHASFVPA